MSLDHQHRFLIKGKRNWTPKQDQFLDYRKYWGLHSRPVMKIGSRPGLVHKGNHATLTEADDRSQVH